MRSFSFNDVKNVYDKADKNFNPKKKGLDGNKDVNPMAFNSRIYFKFLAMSSKTINKALKSNNVDYYKIVEETNGDYSRRRGSDIAAQVKAHVDWANDTISQHPGVRYSFLGVFADVYSILSDMKWKAAFKLAFDFCRKNGDTKTIISAIKNLYFGMVVSCETTLLKVIELEYNISLGTPVEEALLQLQNKYYVFMKKNIVPTINLYCLMKNINDPIQYVKNIITGENKAKKATENFTIPMYIDEKTRSTEGRMWDTIKHSAGAITNLIASSGTTAFGTIATTAAATGSAIGAITTPFAVIITVIGGLWFIFTLLPSIRIIIYYAMISKTNMQKELKLNEEMLRNNIAVLQAKYNSMRDGPEKEKLGEIIEKQKKYYKEILGKIEDDNRNHYNDDTITDSELDKDDADTDKEAEQVAEDSGNGDSSDDDFNVMI